MGGKNHNQNNSASSVTQNVSSTDNVGRVSSTSTAIPTGNSLSSGEGTMSQVLQIVEKKIRNLEKRKVKLDGYRDDKDKGKALDQDQKAAVAKYGEVLGNLEFAKELTTLFKTMALDEEKAKKKQLKKENQERHIAEIKKVASTLEIKELVGLISTPKVYTGLSNGEHGLPHLTQEQIDSLEEFGRLITLRRSDYVNKNEYEKSLLTSATHISLVISGDGKQFGKTTYKELYNTLEKIRDSKYFEQKTPIEDSTSFEGSKALSDVSEPVPSAASGSSFELMESGFKLEY